MASNKRKPKAKPTVTPAGVGPAPDVKILVSGHRGLLYRSLTSDLTIDFDKEIAPGIFTPSAPVPDDLAEDYRNVVGTCGVLVQGSLKREMTSAEIQAERQLRGDVAEPFTISKYESLTAQVEGRFDKVLADLPANARKIIEQHSILRIFWDGMNAQWRRHQTEKWDYQNDPALEEVRRIDWDKTTVDWRYWQKVASLTAKEFCILRHVHDPRKFDAARDNIPGGEGKTLGERVSDDVRIIKADNGGHKDKDKDRAPLSEWIEWADSVEWELPNFMREDEAKANMTQAKKAVSSSKIIACFDVERDAEKNKKWWDVRMRSAKRYFLRECRASAGRARNPSMWYPAQIAGWLVDKKHRRELQVANILRFYFKDDPVCMEAAEMLAPTGN